jgi:hypothetical protein
MDTAHVGLFFPNKYTIQIYKSDMCIQHLGRILQEKKFSDLIINFLAKMNKIHRHKQRQALV